MDDLEIPAAQGPQGNPPAAEPTQTQERPTQVEGDGSAPEVTASNGREFNVQNYVNANKRITDGLKKDMAEMKELITRIAQPAPAPAPSAPSPEVDIFTDPKAYVQREVKQALAAGLSQELGKERLMDQQEKAEAYILSQDYIDPESEDARAELKKIFQERGFKHVWNTNPFSAAEGVLEIYRARKGIGKSTPSRAQAGAVLSGASSNGSGQKTWTPREVAALSLQDYEKNRVDIENALKEGRYKE